MQRKRRQLLLSDPDRRLRDLQTQDFHSAPWIAANGAIFDLGSNTLRPDQWTSADAAGLPVLPGLVRVDEVLAGAIHHAVRFTMDSTANAFIHPATHGAGRSGAGLPPMGLRLRLKASFDTSSHSGAALVILQAMQRYGIILADNGSDWYVTGGDFEVVDTGPAIPVE